MINAPGWLTARPIAHRGLHSGQIGLVENTPAAAAAALAKNYAIECDIQRTKDGEAVVFHDAALDRLMRAEGRVDAFTAGQLRRLAYKECDQSINSLSDFLARISGRSPVIVEVKSHYDGDMRLAGRALAVTENYSGPICLKSFDPSVLIHLRRSGARCPVGLVARALYEDEEWANVPRDRLASFADLRDFPAAQPDFLSWNTGDLPHAVPLLCREVIGIPVMTWVVRSGAAAESALRWADQIIFEGFEP
ncbi:MAG: glycerophosphodiester phosphodiesterase [Beijerinckiaceae bacterium]|nr:glycerophosphodiester phosphodiesterase [Beijerinckiaceae bacterium]MCI0737170.1 glycerophosphodiester phosphodiesterase [Beijerinckiaceae bacterium]